MGTITSSKIDAIPSMPFKWINSKFIYSTIFGFETKGFFEKIFFENCFESF